MKNQTLDEFLMDENTTVFSISHGRTMRKGPLMRGIGALLLGTFLLYFAISLALEELHFGVLMIFLFGLILFLAGSFVCFARSGVDIDVRNKKIREYLFFFKKWGSWHSIAKYPYLCVIKLHKNITYGTYVGIQSWQSPVSGRTEENEDYEICLLNKTHYKRISIAITQDYESAKKQAEKLASQIGVTLTEFNPVRISERKSRSKSKR